VVAACEAAAAVALSKRFWRRRRRIAKKIQRLIEVAARPTRTKTAVTAPVLLKKLFLEKKVQERT
jgi:hypothetical protein